jgi:hypothetical protein
VAQKARRQRKRCRSLHCRNEKKKIYASCSHLGYSWEQCGSRGRFDSDLNESYHPSDLSWRCGLDRTRGRARISAGFNGEQCPGCAGIVRDYCDALCVWSYPAYPGRLSRTRCACVSAATRCFSRFGKKCGPKLQPVNPRPRVATTPPLGPVLRRSRMGTTPSTQPASPLFENAASTSVLPLWFIKGRVKPCA